MKPIEITDWSWINRNKLEFECYSGDQRLLGSLSVQYRGQDDEPEVSVETLNVESEAFDDAICELAMGKINNDYELLDQIRIEHESGYIDYIYDSWRDEQ